MTKVNAEKCRTFSELKGISESNSLNESLGKLTQKNGVVDGSGVLFSPLPGFFFGYCGQLKVESPMSQSVYYDEQVFALTLVLEGACNYTVGGAANNRFSLQKNMFVAGCWDGIDVETAYPKQASYSHIGFLLTKTAADIYLGKVASREIRRIIESKGGPEKTVVGSALSETIVHIQQALNEAQNDSASALLALRCGALNCFVMLMNNLFSFGAGSRHYPPHQADVRQIVKLKDHIDENFLEISTVKDVCSQFCMSLSKANNLFKAQYRVTIAQYIHDYKMAYAYSRLVERKCNVTECAMEVGYSNISHFISSFKKRYKLTPKAVTLLHLPSSHEKRGETFHSGAGNAHCPLSSM